MLLASAFALPVQADSSAASDYRIGVLELASGAREPAFSRAFVERLRAYVQIQPRFLLCQVPGTLDNLASAAACSSTEPGCLRTLADRLNVDGLLFGTVEESDEGPVVFVRRFDVASGQITHDARAKFRAPTTRSDRLDPEVRHLVLELLGNAENSVALTAPPPQVPSETSVRPAPSAALRRAAVSESGSDGGRVAGYVLLGAAAVSTGLVVMSSLQVQAVDDRAEYIRYREAVGKAQPKLSDVCEEAAAGRAHGVSSSELRAARDSCDTGSLFEVLQFVFLGGAVLTGGLGAYFLLSGDDDEESRARALRLSPRAGADRVGLQAELSF